MRRRRCRAHRVDAVRCYSVDVRTLLTKYSNVFSIGVQIPQRGSDNGIPARKAIIYRGHIIADGRTETWNDRSR